MKASQTSQSAMISRLKWKSIAVIMIIVLIFVSSILLTLYLSSQASFQRRSQEILRTSLRRIEERGGSRKPASSPVFKASIDQNGKTVVLSNHLSTLDEETLVALVKSLSSAKAREGTVGNLSLRYLSEPQEDKIVYVLTDISIEQEALQAQLLHSLGIGAFTLLIFFGVSLLLSRWIVRPVAKAWEDQRRFVADASHELKTPLTVVLANADMLSEAGAVQGERNLRRLENIRAEAQRMRGLVEDLLTLARSDARRSAPAMEPVDLTQLISYSLLSLEPAVFEAGRSLEDHIEPGLRIQADPAQIRQLLDILMDNACKYSPAGSTINISLHSNGKKEALLSVRSEGQPIPSEEKDAIFRRFYRLDPSRSGSSGYGLGLSIAQMIVQEHKGRIQILHEDDHSNTFAVTLPTLE